MTIRMLKDVAKFTMLSWFWMRDQGAIVEDIDHYFRIEGRPTKSSKSEQVMAHQLQRELCNNNFHYDYNLNMLIALLTEQISKADNPNSDHSVIDEILRILQSPYGRNQFSGETIKLLRRAVLMPDEIVALRAQLEKVEGKCAGCGREFRSGEVTTYVAQEGNRNLERVFFCLACHPPDYVRCQKCGDFHGLSRSLRENLRKSPKCPGPRPGLPNAIPGPAPVNVHQAAPRAAAPSGVGIFNQLRDDIEVARARRRPVRYAVGIDPREPPPAPEAPREFRQDYQGEARAWARQDDDPLPAEGDPQ